MKTANPLWDSLGILTGAVILLIALTQDVLRTVLVSVAAAVWMVWLAVLLIMRHQKQSRWRKEHSETESEENAEEYTTKQLLLNHVNYRISACLCAAYPEATWQWCMKDPVRFVCKGGTGRIRVFGVDEYEYADIRIDRRGNLSCSLIKSVRLDQEGAGGTGNDKQKTPPNKQPVDPRVWYETQGRAVLERLVADLNSRGHSSLTLLENGDISIQEDKKDVTVEHFSVFPEKVYWPGLIRVLQGDGLAADATTQGIQITW